ncbi:MAG: hypothetical protein ACKO9V_08475 [Candidatus Kapaibacterium sp.]
MSRRNLSLCLFLSFLLVLPSWAQLVDINVTVRNEKGAYATVLLGFDAKATSGIDNALGEFAIPGFPPTPAGLQAALVYRDNGQAVLAYRDYRPLPVASPSRDTFLLTLTPATDESRGSSIIFTWAYPLRQGVDSIVISDLFGGLLYRMRFDAREADTVRGNALNLENFRIIVYTSQLRTSVDGEDEECGMVNPRAAIHVHGGQIIADITCEAPEYVVVSLCDMRGEVTIVDSQEGTFRFPDVTPGLYVIRYLDRRTMKVLAQRFAIHP